MSKFKEIRLSPFLVAMLATSATLGFSKPSNGQTINPMIATTTSEPSNQAEVMPTATDVRSIAQPSYVNQEAVPVLNPVLSRVKPATGNFVVPIMPLSSSIKPVTAQAQNRPTEIPTPTPAPAPRPEPRPEPTPPPFPDIPTPTPTPDIPTPVEPTTTPTPTPAAPTTTPVEPNTTPSPTPDPEPQSQPPAAPEARVLVAEVFVSGAEGQLEDEIFRVIQTRAGQATTRSQLQADVNAIFATGFFANVDVRPEDTPLGVRVTFIVQANPILRQVTINTVPENATQRVLTQKDVDDIFGKQYGQILNFRQLQNGIKELNQLYKDKGFDLAQVIDASKVTPDGKVNLIVAEGVVEDIRVRYLNKEGQEKNDQGEPVRGRTRPFIITREVQLKPGDVFNRQVAERDLRRVFGLGIFEDVRLSFAPGTDPRRVVVVVDVIEKNTGSIAAGAGISSSSGLFGSVSYQQQNLGGNNQTLGAEVQLGQQALLLFDLSFTDPWIAGDPYRTSYTVNAFRRQSISLIFDGGKPEVNLPNGDRPRIVRTGGGVSFTRPLSRDVFKPAEWVASAGLQYQRVAIRDADGNRSPVDELGNNLSFSGEGSDDLLTLQLGAVRDRRNSPIRPTSGSLLRVGLEQSVPVGQGSILLTRLRGNYSYYIPVKFTNFSKGPQALAFNLQGGTIIGDLPPYEAFALGGSNSVRGYGEGDVGAGRSFIQATAEYRFPIISVIGGALFVDFGSDLGTGGNVPGNPGGVRGKPGSGVGYGLGVRVQSPLGPIRIDFGFNDQGDNRIHFGIGERF